MLLKYFQRASFNLQGTFFPSETLNFQILISMKREIKSCPKRKKNVLALVLLLLPDVYKNCLFFRTHTALLLAASLEERSRDDKHLLDTVIRGTAVINSPKVSSPTQILYKQ